METNLVTLSFEYGDDSKLHISNSSLDGANISEVDLYYIGKELERYGKELSRSVSRVENVAGNNGKFITIIRNKLVSIIYERIISYINKVDADMKDGYINLYTYQMSEIVKDVVEKGIKIGDEVKEYAFDLNEFFSTDTNGNFVYEEAVDKFLESLTKLENIV